MEDHIRASILPTALGGHCATAGGCTTLKEAAAHGTPAEEGSHQELSPKGGTCTGASLPPGNAVQTCAVTVLEELEPTGRTHAGAGEKLK